jgi:hypothetical protein
MQHRDRHSRDREAKPLPAKLGLELDVMVRCVALWAAVAVAGCLPDIHLAGCMAECRVDFVDCSFGAENNCASESCLVAEGRLCLEDAMWCYEECARDIEDQL